MRKKALRFMVLFGVATIVMGLLAAAPALAVKPLEFGIASSKIVLGFTDYYGSSSHYSTGQRRITSIWDGMGYLEAHAIWKSSDRKEIMYAGASNYTGASNDSGELIWGPPVTIETFPEPRGSNSEVIAIDPVTWDVHVVYDYSDGTMPKIRHVAGYGDLWDSSTDVSGTIPGSYGKTVAAYGGTAHVVWHSSSGGVEKIYHAVSSDRQTWNVSDTGFFGREPNIISDADGNLYMSWRVAGTNEIFLSKSLYDPAASTWGNWSPPSMANDGTISVDFLSMAVQNSSNIYIAWQTLVDGVRSIVCAYTSDGGATWDQSVVDSHNGNGSFVSVAAGPTGEVNVAWGRGTAGIYVSRSTDGGQTWQPSTQVPESQEGRFPNLTVDHLGKMLIMWPEHIMIGRYSQSNAASFTQEK